jgi:hypothetical protein
MLDPAVHRVWQGVRLEGEQIHLQLLPHHDGRLSVTVYAQPALTGWDRTARVTPDKLPNHYAADEIAVRDTELTCLAVEASHVPHYRQGFALTLEPGMAQLLRAWLPQLLEVAALASDIMERVDSSCARRRHPSTRTTCTICSPASRLGWYWTAAIRTRRSGSSANPAWRPQLDRRLRCAVVGQV